MQCYSFYRRYHANCNRLFVFQEINNRPINGMPRAIRKRRTPEEKCHAAPGHHLGRPSVEAAAHRPTQLITASMGAPGASPRRLSRLLHHLAPPPPSQITATPITPAAAAPATGAAGTGSAMMTWKQLYQLDTLGYLRVESCIDLPTIGAAWDESERIIEQFGEGREPLSIWQDAGYGDKCLLRGIPAPQHPSIYHCFWVYFATCRFPGAGTGTPSCSRRCCRYDPRPQSLSVLFTVQQKIREKCGIQS